MDLRLVEDLARNEMAGCKFTVFVGNAFFLEGFGDVPGMVDLDELVAPPMEDPDVNARDMGDILDIGCPGEGNSGRKEIGTFVNQVPDTVATERESGEVDALWVRGPGFLEKVFEKGKNGVPRKIFPAAALVALGGNEDAGALGEITDEGGRHGDLGLPDIIRPALG